MPRIQNRLLYFCIAAKLAAIQKMSTPYICRRAATLLSQKYNTIVEELASDCVKSSKFRKLTRQQLSAYESKALHLLRHDRRPFMLNWIYLFERNQHEISSEFYEETLDCAIDLVENGLVTDPTDLVNMLWAISKRSLRSGIVEKKLDLECLVLFVIDHLDTLIQYNRISLLYVITRLNIELNLQQSKKLLASIKIRDIQDNSEILTLLDFYAHTSTKVSDEIVGPVFGLIGRASVWTLEKVQAALNKVEPFTDGGLDLSVLQNMCARRHKAATDLSWRKKSLEVEQ